MDYSSDEMSEDEELEGAQDDATREKTNIETAMWNEPGDCGVFYLSFLFFFLSVGLFLSICLNACLYVSSSICLPISKLSTIRY